MNEQSANADKPHFIKPEEVKDSEVYRALIALYLQRDTLSWSRTQALGIVEIGVLTASFAKKGPLAVVCLVAGSFLIYLIWCLIQRDWQCRDHFYKNALDSVHEPRGIRLAPEARPERWGGSWIMPKIVWTLVIVNVLLAAIFVFDADSFLERPSRDLRAIEIRTPGRSQLTYPIEPDKDISIEFDGTKGFSMLIFAPRLGSPFERSIEINVAGSHLLDSLVAYTYTLAPNGQRTSVTESQGRAKEALAKEASGSQIDN